MANLVKLSIASGTIMLNSRGFATIEVDVFEGFDENDHEFAYFLTAVGQSMPRLFVASQFCGGRFLVGGGQPLGIISWMIVATERSRGRE